MKSTYLLTTLLAMVFFFSSCAPTIYVSPDFDKVKNKHKVVAILPFNVQISAKNLPKNVTQEMIRDDEQKTGYAIQGHSYTAFLKESGKRNYTVKFQDIDKTNSTLAKMNVGYADLRAKGKDELCKLLEVDAVISGDVHMEKPMSEGSAIAVGLLFGYWGSTNKVNVTMSIHEKTQGDLLWKYDWVAEGGVGSSSEQLGKNLVKKRLQEISVPETVESSQLT